MVSFSWPQAGGNDASKRPPAAVEPELDAAQAEEILQGLVGVFTQNAEIAKRIVYPPVQPDAAPSTDQQFPNLEARYRALVEQIPAVVFMAYLDRGTGEAYVSPQIEAALGFSQEEWLEDPVRWYSHINPDDKQRWSSEAAEMFL
ncbi:MAG: PAS domain-containing protein, partial [Terriglobales bacterium]